MAGLGFCLGKDFASSSRPEKGKSLLDLLDDYFCIDIETTGFDSHFDEIIELAAVHIVDGAVADTFQTLVKPQQEIGAFITELTGITNDMVSNAPLIDDALPTFRDFLGEATLVGHNVNFDVNFIFDFSRLIDLPPFSNNFVDTLRISRRAFPEWENHKLHTMVEKLGIPPRREHRALDDCMQTALCYEALKRHIKDNNINLKAVCTSSYNSLSKHITAQTDQFDQDSPIFGKVFAFTGTLEKMPRREAMQFVVNAGGICGDGVTKETHYLVLGNNDYCKSIQGGKSAKQKKAEKMRLEGHDIEIISENVFYDMLNE